MLAKLTPEQLDTVAPIGADGTITVDTEQLAVIVAEHLGEAYVALAISSVDYDQHPDGTPEPNTRTIKGLWWVPTEEDYARVGSFRSDGYALSIQNEGEKLSPIAEDSDLVAKAICAVADQYEDSEIRDSLRVDALMPDGSRKQIRVVVTRDPRIVRPEDVLNEIELIAYRHDRLGVAMVQPLKDGKALVRKMGC